MLGDYPQAGRVHRLRGLCLPMDLAELGRSQGVIVETHVVKHAGEGLGFVRGEGGAEAETSVVKCAHSGFRDFMDCLRPSAGEETSRAASGPAAPGRVSHALEASDRSLTSARPSPSTHEKARACTRCVQALAIEFPCDAEGYGASRGTVTITAAVAVFPIASVAWYRPVQVLARSALRNVLLFASTRIS